MERKENGACLEKRDIVCVREREGGRGEMDGWMDGWLGGRKGRKGKALRVGRWPSSCPVPAVGKVPGQADNMRAAVSVWVI